MPSNAGAPLMTYPRLRVRLAMLSIEAFVVINKLWLYCQDVGNGGRIPLRELPVACDRLMSPAKLRRAIDELAEPSADDDALWLSVVDDVILMPRWWLAINPGPEVWQDDMARKVYLRNKQLHSPKCSELKEKVRVRDRNLCRYCGVRVDWTARNNDIGATHDHVDPDGDNTFSNVVVACRRCNGRKGHRTPEQWIEQDPKHGRKLLPAGTTAEQAQRLRFGAGPPESGLTQVEPESNPSTRTRATPPRVEPGSNPIRPVADLFGSIPSRPESRWLNAVPHQAQGAS